MWIEIFKTGTHTDSSGAIQSFAPEDLDRIATLYNSRISGSPTQEAPLVKGHPKSDDPAHGWVERLARRGGRLLAKLRSVSEELAGDIRKGSFRRVSAAFYPDFMLRHVGFLGAAAPAVRDLMPLNYEAEGLREFGFDIGNTDNGVDEKTDDSAGRNPDGNLDWEKEKERLRRQIDELEKEIRLKGFRDFTSSLIHDTGNSSFAPAHAPLIIDLLEAAHNADISSRAERAYSENTGLLPRLREFLKNLKMHNGLEKPLEGERPGRQAEADFLGRNLNPARLRLHEQARRIMDASPGLSYEEAVIFAGRSNDLL